MGAYLRPFRRMGTMGTGNRDLVAPPLVRFLKNDKMDTVPSASDPEPEFSPGMGEVAGRSGLSARSRRVGAELFCGHFETIGTS